MTKGKRPSLSANELLEQALVLEDEQPYEVPKNWVWVKLGSVINANPPKLKMNDFIDNDQCSFVPMAAVSDTEGIIFAAEEREFKQVKTGYTQFLDGDVIFAKITPCMENGKSAIVEGLINGIGYGSTEFYVLRTTELLINRLLYHLVRSSAFRADAKQHMTGAVGQQRVPKKFIEEYPFPLPPLAEQQRIVDRIDNLFAKLDQAKELAQNAFDSFETRKVAILHKAFTGELTSKWREEHDVGMDSWKEKPIESLGDVKGGKRLPKGASLTNEDTGFPYIKAGDLKNGTVLVNKIQYVTPEVQKIIKNYTVTTGDVYITIVGACIGDVGVVPEIMDKANLTENAAKITNLKCDSNYLGLCMSSNIIQDQINSKIASATLGKLSLQNIKSLVLTIPSLDEQREIVRILHSVFEKENRTKELLQLIDKIDLMKKAILIRAFHGELGTNDPSEESALI